MQFEISLNDLSFYAFHGVMEEERRLGNVFKVSLSVVIPFEEEIAEDNIQSTVSYVSLYDIVEQEMKNPCNLLETLALRIVKRIKNQFRFIVGGWVRIEKVHPPIPGMLGTASVKLNF